VTDESEALGAIGEDEFRQLVRNHHARMIAIADTYVVNRATAEEVVQEAWLAVIEGIYTLKDRRSLIPWIYRILANKAKRRGQRDKRLQFFTEFDSPACDDTPDPERFTRLGFWRDQVPEWDDADPERILAGKQLWEHIQQAIGELPETHLRVLLLSTIEELTPDEVCHILEISPGNRRILLHRARNRLRQTLEDLLSPPASGS